MDYLPAIPHRSTYGENRYNGLFVLLKVMSVILPCLHGFVVIIICVFSSFQTPGTWGQTLFEINTRRTNRLPIIDIATYVTSERSQQFEVTVGETCFH